VELSEGYDQGSRREPFDLGIARYAATSFLRPVELGSVDPYAVQNYRELARDGNCGLSLLVV
jgi:hypothetical protein